MHPFLNTATTAVRKAGNIIVRAMQDLNAITVKEKARFDYVTEIDQQAEAVILDIIKKAYPDHAILAEESGQHHANGDYEWIIDPLDGTKNFIHGLPHLCISVAIKYKGRLEHALIYDPIRDELFTASRGNGARLNNYRIRVANLPNLKHALVSTSIITHMPESLAEQAAIFDKISPDVAGIRITGSAALSLAHIAAGRLDAYWEKHLKIWDIAAGALIVREAGGIITDINGSDDYLTSGNIIAGNLKIVRQLLTKIN